MKEIRPRYWLVVGVVLLALIAVGASDCDKNIRPSAEMSEDKGHTINVVAVRYLAETGVANYVYIIEIDGCQYVGTNPQSGLTHKANCPNPVHQLMTMGSSIGETIRNLPLRK